MRSPSHTRLVPMLLALLLPVGAGVLALTPEPDHGPVLKSKHYVPTADQWSTLAASGLVESPLPTPMLQPWAFALRSPKSDPESNRRTSFSFSKRRIEPVRTPSM